MYMAGAIREAVTALISHPDAVMAYADGLMVDADGRLLDPHRYRRYELVDLLCFEVLLQPTVFMRRDALLKAGLLRETYHLVLDHELWIRMALQGPLLHVPSYWAVERTHMHAKTVAQAGGWVDEAERFLAQAEGDEALSPILQRHHRRIYASLDAFAGRRLIDAGHYRQAVRRFVRAMIRYPPVALRYWYKFVQASVSAIGLASLFFGYRKTRRRIQYPDEWVQLGEGGGVRRSR
jgi:hypothetical protein